MEETRVRNRIARVRSVVALAALVLAPTVLEAQTGSIRGEVVDAVTQRPIGGAQVEIVDTRQGGLTNTSGQFLVLNVPVGDHEVRIQFIGFATMSQTVSVASGETAVLDFELARAALQLDQIVVTGTAQETQARSVGNTVSTIDAAEIVEIAPISTVQELLTARTPGLTLMSNSGQAGSSSKLRIRGAGSLAAGLQPVVYVDGIRMKSGTQGGLDVSWGGAQGTDALDFLNPNDIESIETIKGPAASTLYGADAAGGVIQIITKKGRAGSGLVWNISFETGYSEWALDTPTNYWRCTASNIASPDVYPGCAGFAENTVLTDDPVKRHPMALRQNEGGPDDYADLSTMNISARGGGNVVPSKI